MAPQTKAHLHHLSRILSLPVMEDPKARTGRIRDLVVQAGGAEARVTGLVLVDRSGKERRIPAEAVLRVGAREVRLKEPLARLPDKAISPNEILLAEHLLDKKVIDTRRKKVLRVSDIEIREKEGELVVVAVDAGLAGMVRRLGFPLKGTGSCAGFPGRTWSPWRPR